MTAAAPAQGAARAGPERRKSRRRRTATTTTRTAAARAAAAVLLVTITLGGARAIFPSVASLDGARGVIDANSDPQHAEEVLIGWKGETWQPGEGDGGGSGGGGGGGGSSGSSSSGPEEESEGGAHHPQGSEYSKGRSGGGGADGEAAGEASGNAGQAATTTAAAAAEPHAPGERQQQQQHPAPPRGGGGGDDRQRGWVELLSWRPRAFLHHGFLSDAECDHIIMLTEGRVERSGVVDAKTGKTRLDPIRTSTGAALARGQDATVAEIERRAAEWTRLPPSHAESMQVLRYENGQTYKAHWDWFDDPVHTKEAESVGNRIATVLFYLSDVDEGGATTLPLAFPANATRAREAYPPDPNADPQCAGAEPGGMGIAVRPRKGDALLFWDMLPDGKTTDRRALHASCPTVRGVKYTATLWVHSKPYGIEYDPVRRAARCEDFDKRCEAWAAERPVSRCDAEPKRLLGLRGVCRRSCRDCAVCAADDVLCQRANGRSRRAELLAWDEERRRKGED